MISEKDFAIEVYSGILDENIGKTIFVEYLENNDTYIQPFEVLEKTSNNTFKVKQIYDNSTVTKDISAICQISIQSEERTQKLVDDVLNIDNLLDEPAYQMIEKGTDDYNTFQEKKFLSSNGIVVPMESIYLAIKLGYNNYDEILTADVDELKTKWLALINEHKNKAIEILTTEKTNSQNEGNTDDVEEIEVILSLLNDLTTEINDEMSSLSDRESILTYWPPLLLPAPIYLSTT
jgi:hypothetical protein